MFSLKARDTKKLTKDRVLDLQNQAGVCIKIFEILQAGVLLLDEVDVILHPLKSELNWPLGQKFPLDFTVSANGLDDGLRWQVPWHILDALFFNAERRMTVDLNDSVEAIELLHRIAQKIEEGSATNYVQRTPHFVILSTKFYKKDLLPLLAQWTLLWASQHIAAKDIPDSVLLDYLIYGPRHNAKGTELINAQLVDDQMKMLNLSRDWLTSVAPFVLAKINRVKFGLLSPEDIARNLATDPLMSKNRKLTAVPFVAKDVPSQSSEFAQPDVVIGLTILAFRYEGLRRSDFDTVMESLFDQLNAEQGPYRKRPACKKFARWVHHAGGQVRGYYRRAFKSSEEKGEGDEKHESAKVMLRNRIDEEGIQPELYEVFQDIWPLQLVDYRDNEQMEPLFYLLRKVPELIQMFVYIS